MSVVAAVAVTATHPLRAEPLHLDEGVQGETRNLRITCGALWIAWGVLRKMPLDGIRERVAALALRPCPRV